jgi:hypothetical protein
MANGLRAAICLLSKAASRRIVKQTGANRDLRRLDAIMTDTPFAAIGVAEQSRVAVEALLDIEPIYVAVMTRRLFNPRFAASASIIFALRL